MSKQKIKPRPAPFRKSEPELKEEFSISWKYITEDNNYRLSRFKNDTGEYKSFTASFVKLMENLSHQTWVGLLLLGKKQGGVETLPESDLKHARARDYDGEIRNYISIRFGSKDAYRMIGFKEGNVFYITGFDLDFSAYDHS